MELASARSCIVRGYILLADHAEAIGGKLYIMGGGWSQLSLGEPTADISVAGMVYVPWDSANRKMRMLLRLMDQDGHEVEIGGQSVGLNGQIEVGRPPGMTPGSDLEVPIAARFNSLPIEPGRYVFELSVGSHRIGEAKFEVHRYSA